MKSSGIQHFVFLTLNAKGAMNDHFLEQAINNYLSISEDSLKSLANLPNPYSRLIPMTEDFFEFVKNSFLIENSISEFLRVFHMYRDKNAQVISITKEEFVAYLNKFSDLLVTTQKRLIFNLNEVSVNISKVQNIRDIVQVDEKQVEAHD